MLLENKVAVIYGAGGSIGGAVTRAFAREGARVFLGGRTKAKLDRVADDIRSNGGVVDTAVVDALDERTVDEYVDAVVEDAGHIDISFSLISYGDIQQPLTEISVEDFTRPITTAADEGGDPRRCRQRGSLRGLRSSRTIVATEVNISCGALMD